MSPTPQDEAAALVKRLRNHADYLDVVGPDYPESNECQSKLAMRRAADLIERLTAPMAEPETFVRKILREAFDRLVAIGEDSPEPTEALRKLMAGGASPMAELQRMGPTREEIEKAVADYQISVGLDDGSAWEDAGGIADAILALRSE